MIAFASAWAFATTAVAASVAVHRDHNLERTENGRAKSRAAPFLNLRAMANAFAAYLAETIHHHPADPYLALGTRTYQWKRYFADPAPTFAAGAGAVPVAGTTLSPHCPT